MVTQQRLEEIVRGVKKKITPYKTAALSLGGGAFMGYISYDDRLKHPNLFYIIAGSIFALATLETTRHAYSKTGDPKEKLQLIKYGLVRNYLTLAGAVATYYFFTYK